MRFCKWCGWGPVDSRRAPFHDLLVEYSAVGRLCTVYSAFVCRLEGMSRSEEAATAVGDGATAAAKSTFAISNLLLSAQPPPHPVQSDETRSPLDSTPPAEEQAAEGDRTPDSSAVVEARTHAAPRHLLAALVQLQQRCNATDSTPQQRALALLALRQLQLLFQRAIMFTAGNSAGMTLFLHDDYDLQATDGCCSWSGLFTRRPSDDALTGDLDIEHVLEVVARASAPLHHFKDHSHPRRNSSTSQMFPRRRHFLHSLLTRVDTSVRRPPALLRHTLRITIENYEHSYLTCLYTITLMHEHFQARLSH